MVSAAAETTASMGWSRRAEDRKEVMLRKQILSEKKKRNGGKSQPQERRREEKEKRARRRDAKGSLVGSRLVVPPSEIHWLSEVNNVSSRSRVGSGNGRRSVGNGSGSLLSDVVLISLGHDEVA